MGKAGAREGSDDVSAHGPRKYSGRAGRFGGNAGPVRRHQAHSTMVRDGASVKLALHGTQTIGDPARLVARSIEDALDPAKAPSKPKTWAQMTESERSEMRRLYERGGK